MTHPDTALEVSPVVQADREAAATLSVALWRHGLDLPHNIAQSLVDSGPTVQAFAQHRLAAERTPPAQAAVRELREAIRACRDFAEGRTTIDVGDGGGLDVRQLREARRHIGTLVKALATPAPAPSSVPEGWVLVPREPTREMYAAYDYAAAEWAKRSGLFMDPEQTWKAMFAAAHPQPGQARENVSHG